jgi:acetyl esterase
MLSPKLDPVVRQLLLDMEAQNNPPMESVPVEETRQQVVERFRPVGGVPEPMASVEDRRIPGPAGDIPVRIYTPDAAGPRPAMVYFHGGGFVICNLDTHDVVCRALARRAGALVVSVDYRLAPESKFPAAVDDCYAATVWTAEHAAELGADPERLSVCGDSCGGTLATAVALKSREEQGPKIALQAMVYPITDLSTFETPSYAEFGENHQLTKPTMAWFRNHYLRSEEDGRHPYASPLLARDLSGLPPALIITAECDPLRDEAEAYAKRLEQAGVPVTCTRYAGMIHPFFALSGVIRQAVDAFDQIAAAVRAASIRTRAASQGSAATD